MKKIDKLLLKSFIGPFAVAFGIALFVLIMQFLWLYIDEIAGKGVSIFVMFELLGYLSISVFPMGLAIATLISSVMVMGGFSERYELSSMKSAGVSLMRVMRPLALTAVGVAIFSWICSNYLIPIANLQFKTRLYDIRKQKPALTLEAGVFNEDFRNFSIRIGKKSKDGETIGNIMVDDASQTSRNEFSQILADSGRMFTSADKRFFVMDLHRGTQYQAPNPTAGKRKYPFTRTNFAAYRKVWDMKEFDMSATDPNAFKENRTMLSMAQLRIRVDSLNFQMELGRKDIQKDLTRIFNKKTVAATLHSSQNTDSLILENAKKRIEQPPVPVEKKQLPADDPKPSAVRRPPIAVDRPPPAVDRMSRTEEMKKRFAQKFGEKLSGTQNPNESAASGEPPKAEKKPVAPPSSTPKTAAAPDKQPQKNEVKPPPEGRVPGPPYSEEELGAMPVQDFKTPVSDTIIWLKTFPVANQIRLRQSASTLLNGANTQLLARVRSNERYEEEMIKTAYELYLKYCFAMICVVFMFIGAPLGAIIRKGGFGYSVVIAIFFFMVFVTLYITCRKLAETHTMTPFWAAMTPCMVLAPVGLWLTVKARNDSQVFNLERYERFFRMVGEMFVAGFGRMRKAKMGEGAQNKMDGA